MEIITGSEARKNFFQLPQHLEYGNEIYIKMKNQPDMVLLSAEDWRGIQETIYLHSIPGMVSSIKKSRKTAVSKHVKLKDLDW